MIDRATRGFRGNASLALVAPMALSLANPAWGDCTNDAGTGDIAEGEPCLVDLATNQIDDGCNFSPNIFFELGPADFAGDGIVRICGSASNFDGQTTTPCTVGGDCANPPNLCLGGLCAVNRRDTDWYRISAEALAAADTDSNGAVQLTSHVVAEFDAVTFFISVGDPVCDPLSVETGVGCFDAGPDRAVDVTQAVLVADHPNGLVVFVAPGLCSGGGIFDGYECGDVPALNDYVVTITLADSPFMVCGDPDLNPGLGDCACPNPGVPGCADPNCCAPVCTVFNPLCCTVEWDQPCAAAAVSLGCWPCIDYVQPIASGFHGDCAFCPDASDGLLVIWADAFGGWADPSFGGGGDYYNPPGAMTAQRASFSNAFFMYRPEAQQRELLADSPQWKAALGLDDASLSAEITCEYPPNCPHGFSDTNGDGAFDRQVSQFRVTGAGVDLTFDLTQQAESITPAGGDPVGVLTQTYSIQNNLAADVSFTLLRQADFNLVWDGGAENDSVGTETNGSPLDRHVFQGEAGQPATHVTMSSPQGSRYVGAKSGADPDGPGPAPAMGAGTSTQEWDAYGVPEGWGNFIAYVGYDANGASGAASSDAHVLLEIPVSVAGNGTAVVEFNVTYGAMTPLGQCAWDCGDNDGEVGVVDFLALLDQWGTAGSACDAGGDGVGVSDFLALLGAWGPCAP